MKRLLTLVALASVALMPITETFAAKPKVNPLVTGQSGQPRLGFTGLMLPGVGLRVVSVTPGSVAQQIGLEANDVIVSMNGQTIVSQPHYLQILRQAVDFGGGNVSMVVRNSRPFPPLVTLNFQIPASYGPSP